MGEAPTSALGFGGKKGEGDAQRGSEEAKVWVGEMLEALVLV